MSDTSMAYGVLVRHCTGCWIVCICRPGYRSADTNLRMNANKTQRATQIRRYVSSLGLLPVAFVAWRTIRDWSPESAFRNYKLRRKNARGIPIPPGSLIFSATGTRNVEWFLGSGADTASSFTAALESIGRPIDSFERIFELGCGCGRVLRQWATVRGPKFSASDYNPKGVEWGRKHLDFVEFKVNRLEPPLPFEAGSFDLCYAVSVFTHLPED